jgi:hypothetical protein
MEKHMAQAEIDPKLTMEMEAAVYRRLVSHLRNSTDVKNIDLMNLAGFCRNCLSKWFTAEAESRGLEVDYDEARTLVYGMPYDEWKSLYQIPVAKDPTDKPGS